MVYSILSLCTLIKKKRTISSYIGNSDGIGCKVEGLPLICEEMRKYLTIFEDAVSQI